MLSPALLCGAAPPRAPRHLVLPAARQAGAGGAALCGRAARGPRAVQRAVRGRGGRLGRGRGLFPPIPPFPVETRDTRRGKGGSEIRAETKPNSMQKRGEEMEKRGGIEGGALFHTGPSVLSVASPDTEELSRRAAPRSVSSPPPSLPPSSSLHRLPPSLPPPASPPAVWTRCARHWAPRSCTARPGWGTWSSMRWAARRAGGLGFGAGGGGCAGAGAGVRQQLVAGFVPVRAARRPTSGSHGARTHRMPPVHPPPKPFPFRLVHVSPPPCSSAAPPHWTYSLGSGM